MSIVAHATAVNRLDFAREFVFDEALGETDSGHEPETFALSSLDFNELLGLTGDAPIEVQGGTQVRLADVRRAFPVDAEIHVFNLTNPLQPEFVQALANFFQVRTTAFVQQPVRVLAEVIAVTDPASERVLAKKVDVGFQGDPEGTRSGSSQTCSALTAPSPGRSPPTRAADRTPLRDNTAAVRRGCGVRRMEVGARSVDTAALFAARPAVGPPSQTVLRFTSPPRPRLHRSGHRSRSPATHLAHMGFSVGAV